MINRGKEPPSFILFADTGGELPETYKYIEFFSEWIQSKGYPEIITVSEKVTLEDDCLSRKALPSVAYGFKTCSQRWKARPQERFIKNTDEAKSIWLNSEKVVKIIGIDAGEDQRAKKYDDPKYDQSYPLVEWGIGRDDCIEIIKAAGLPLPGKSSCFFCPNMRKTEIRQMSVTHPEYAERAIKLEQNMETKKVRGLGRTWAWGDMLATEDMFPDDYFKVMPCGCYDG
jgi:hypothetical protein